MKKILVSFCVSMLFVGGWVFAEETEDVFSSFRMMKPLTVPTIKVPTIVAFPLEKGMMDGGAVLHDEVTQTFIPYRIDSKSESVSMITYVRTVPESAMSDGDYASGKLFEVRGNEENRAVISLVTERPITSTSLHVQLDRYVALPQTVKIVAVVDGVPRVVLASTAMKGSTIYFPETTSSEWEVTFEYAQPLRINEMHLAEDGPKDRVSRMVYFLAQPEGVYTLYLDSDRPVSVSTIESGNLYDLQGLRTLPEFPTVRNNRYYPSDVDNDSISDLEDNCVRVQNVDQIDVDQNGRGDVCDDYDRDGVIQSQDNCPLQTNARQEDEDGDGVGDICDDEESRLTEKYVWVPWAGMGIAVAVLLTLFGLVATHPKRLDEAHDIFNSN